MTISRIYKEFLVEDIIRDSLRQGRVLSKKEIEEELAKETETNPELNEPFTQRILYNTEAEEGLSADKMNSVLLTMQNDLSVAYRALTEQASDVTATYDAVTSEFKTIEKRIKTLEGRTGNLLIISRDIEGYFDYVSDTFSNKDKTDISNTDAFVDNKVGVLTLAPIVHNRIPTPVIESDLQFNVITRDQLKFITLAPGSNITAAFTDQETTWLQRVQMARGVGAVTAELIVRMPNTEAEISKVVYRPAVSDAGNISTVSLQYSDDGLNWFNPDGETTAPLQGDITLIFSSTKATYWKFVFNKAGYDEFTGDSYIYEFGAKSIQFYGVEYQKRDNKLIGVFYSKVLEGEKEFNRASLKVCENMPLGTLINYHIAALTPAEIVDYNSGILLLEDLNFNSLDPVTRDTTINPLFIDFKNLNLATGINSSYAKDLVTDFRKKNNVSSLIDYTIPANTIKGELKILRNTGDNTLDGGSNTPVRIKSVDNGWSFDDTFYFCNFYISEDSGKTLDFGPNNLEIDGITVNGETILKKGFHKVKTAKVNWRGISPLLITSTENPDTLYPYNHKYLIEGIQDTLYGDDMTSLVAGEEKKSIVDPEGVYTGVERYWELIMEEVSSFDFAENIEDEEYQVFSFITDFNGDEKIMIKDSLEPGLLTNEKLAIITRTLSNVLLKGIILKAELSSDDTKTTPVLDEYIVRLGF